MVVSVIPNGTQWQIQRESEETIYFFSDIGVRTKKELGTNFVAVYNYTIVTE